MNIFLYYGLAIASWMLLFWLLSIPMRNVAIVDIAWGLGFVIVSLVTLLLVESPSPGALLLVAMTVVWGLRLSGYLAWRNLGKPEDKRYKEMRDLRGGKFIWTSLWMIFGAQGVLVWIISLPLQLGIPQSYPGWHPLHFVGLAIWLIGFLFETIGDAQLVRFKSNPANKGQVLNIGLWRYTRHPNYFGDFLVWWGIFVTSVAGVWSNSWTIIGPLLMSYLLMKFSGVPMLESSMKASRPGYAEYVRQTSGFFPWWPKR